MRHRQSATHHITAFSTVAAALAVAAAMTLAASCSGPVHGAANATPTPAAFSEAPPVSVQRDANVPDLPFADNPDPNACGIPAAYGGGSAWVSGTYQGRVVEASVLLYDSHERLHITGALPSGTEVQVQLYQANPVLDFYYVQGDTPSGTQKGWIPAPFLSFSPPA